MITTPFSHPSFASWKEYFLHHTDVDLLNILHSAYHSNDATVELCLQAASMFDNCWALAASSIAGHVWFMHHFKAIESPLIDHPEMVQHVALCGIHDNAEVCMLDPMATYSIHVS
jgi:hypothetical protein